MMRTDYSQWGEQQIILDFFKGQAEGTFLDLGAFDGVTGSNTRALAELGWTGVMVEASPFAFADLVEEMRPFPEVRLVCAAAMSLGGVTAWQETCSQVSTAEVGGHVTPWVKHRFHVAVATPQAILAAFGGHYDFVSVDVEGMDLDVIRSLGSLLSSTRLLCYETRRPNRKPEPEYVACMKAVLAAHGFTRVIGETNGGSGNTLVAKGA